MVKKACAKVGGTNVLLTFVQVTQLFTIKGGSNNPYFRK